jgi:signal transduction histidine kinase
MLASAGPMREVSLWIREGRKSICLEFARGRPSEGVGAAARRALHGQSTPAGPRRTLIAVAVGIGDPPAGALAARVEPGRSAQALALLDEAKPLLSCLLDRRAMLESHERQAVVLAAAERRLTRFGLDLHDGPAQDVAALLSDIRMFRQQLGSELADHPLGPTLAGRADDLEHRAVSLEAAIRELARTAGGPAVLADSLAPALRSEVKAFALATGVTPALDITGPIDEATDSQRITLLRGVQEALRNAREHSGARSVSVTVTAPPESLAATITDDGAGFDVERTLSRGHRQGHLGLGGIRERVRLLGGRCEIESRRGGPTSVRIVLPRWRPDGPPPEKYDRVR